MESLFRDLRVSWRSLLRRPLFTGIVVLTLALGIGAAVTIFSAVYAILLAPLPFQDPEEVVVVWETKDERLTWAVAPATYLAWKERVTTFEDLAVVRYASINLTGDGVPEQVSGVQASANLFSVLGIQAYRGRLFVPDDGELDAAKVAVLDYGFWRRRFGEDEGVVGRDILLNDEAHTVIGILPPGFRTSYSRIQEVFVPQVFDEALASNGGTHIFLCLGRLRSGSTLESAQAEMDNLAAQLTEERPETNTGWGVNLVPIREQLFGEFRPVLLLLLAAVGLLLLVACVNVAHLLMARNAGRRSETAVRLALGAGARHLLRLHTLEVLLLSLLGGLLGLGLASLGIRALSILNPGDIPRIEQAGLNLPTLGFAVALILLSGLIVAVLPSLGAARMNLLETLGEGSKRAGGGRYRLGTLLVVAESALVLVLLIGAGLMVRSFLELHKVNPGFQVLNRTSVQINLSPQRYPEAVHIRTAVGNLLERIETLPGVVSVGATNRLPIAQPSIMLHMVVDGRPVPPLDERPLIRFDVISDDYLTAMGIPLLEGRPFGPQDTADTQPVILVNETLANTFWPGESAIGHEITGTPEERPWYTVVGVIGDVRQRGLDTTPVPEMVHPFQQLELSFMRSIHFVIQSRAEDTENLLPAIREIVQDLDPEQPLAQVMPLGQVLADAVAQPRFQMILLAFFALTALVLGAVGIYGVVSYRVGERSREIGIRVAMGAQRQDIIKWVLWFGLAPVVIGGVVGVMAALGLSRLVESLLFGVSSRDPLTFFAVPAFLMTIALLATLLPARRAVRVDPATTLRED